MQQMQQLQHLVAPTSLQQLQHQQHQIQLQQLHLQQQLQQHAGAGAGMATLMANPPVLTPHQLQSLALMSGMRQLPDASATATHLALASLAAGGRVSSAGISAAPQLSSPALLRTDVNNMHAHAQQPGSPHLLQRHHSVTGGVAQQPGSPHLLQRHHSAAGGVARSGDNGPDGGSDPKRQRMDW